MARNVAIGIQDFGTIVKEKCFYVDKTDFIREWWESKDSVTLINRPRRFGKTLNMSMVEQFFSIDYANRGDLFEGLSIWQDEKYRQLQGTYPVISLSFARVKELNYQDTREKICAILRNLYIKFSFLKDSETLTDADRAYFRGHECIHESCCTADIQLFRYGKKPGRGGTGAFLPWLCAGTDCGFAE